MVRLLLILAIGASIGYAYGFRDAQRNKTTIVARFIDRVGGEARSYSTNDTDALMLRTEH
jgi:hypothetical protein